MNDLVRNVYNKATAERCESKIRIITSVYRFNGLVHSIYIAASVFGFLPGLGFGI